LAQAGFRQIRVILCRSPDFDRGIPPLGRTPLWVFREHKSLGGWEFQNLQKQNDKHTIGTNHEILWQTLCQTCENREFIELQLQVDAILQS
jgi:hypothetical protein